MEHYMCIYNPKLSQYIKRQTAKKCATYNSASYQTMLFLNYTLTFPILFCYFNRILENRMIN